MIRHDYVRYRHGCRCADCKASNTEFECQRRAQRRLVSVPSFAVHGSRSTYSNYGCRCRPCAQANSDYCAAYHANRRAARV